MSSPSLITTPVLITGVGKRVGLALSRHFLAHNIPVIGTYRTHYDTIDELKNAGAMLYACDFYDQQALENLIAVLRDNHPSLRAIIHNASDWLPDKNDYSHAETMQRMMQIHASVPYQMNLALQENLLSAAVDIHTDIIHITDYVVAKGSKKHMAYAASKAALDNLTMSFASLFAPDIKVNSIAPALVSFNLGDSDEYKEKTLNKSLLPREAGYEEVTATVDMLMKSQYITGRTIHLDGGRHLKA